MTESPETLSALIRSIDEPTLGNVLDGLAASTGATVALFDARGEAVLAPRAVDTLGILLSASTAAAEQVVRFAAAVDLAVNGDGRVEDATRHVCHLVTPVAAGGTRFGAIVLGDRPSDAWSPDHVRALAARWQLAPEALADAARSRQPWTDDTRRSAQALAAGVAALLARLCTQEHQLQERIEELAVVYDVTNMFAGTRDLQELLKLTAGKVCEVMGTKACSIRLFDEQTGELVIKAVHNLSERYLQKGPVLVGENPIDNEAFRGNMVYIEDAPNDPRVRYPDDARLEGIVSGLVCGMVYRGKCVGVIRVYTGVKHRFSPYEWALLRAVATQAAVAIMNARLYNAAVEAERYERQLKYAGDVQRRMIPAAPPASPALAFGCLYKPSREVGGDFYDFIELPRGNLGIAIADVVGKGLPAALMMASLRAALRVYTYHIYDVERIVAQVNEHMCRETRSHEFATVFYGVITPDARRLTYCNAGHEPPLLLRDGRVERLEVGGTVLGVMKGQVFDKALLELHAGDALLLYTDGVVESMNFAEEEFGRRRLAASFQEHAHLDVQRMVKSILWDVRRFIGYSDLADDMTMVGIKVR